MSPRELEEYELFSSCPPQCICYEPEDRKDWPCVCSDTERFVRRYVYSLPMPPMTPQQRAWLAEEADSAGEGAYHAEELLKLDDAHLASACLRAWADYVGTHF